MISGKDSAKWNWGDLRSDFPFRFRPVEASCKLARPSKKEADTCLGRRWEPFENLLGALFQRFLKERRSLLRMVSYLGVRKTRAWKKRSGVFFFLCLGPGGSVFGHWPGKLLVEETSVRGKNHREVRVSYHYKSLSKLLENGLPSMRTPAATSDPIKSPYGRW